MKNIVCIALMMAILCSCNQKVEKVERAFYYWKSGESDLSNKSDSLLQKQEIKKLYVKFFEVDYSEVLGCFPFSKSEFRNYSYQKDYRNKLLIVPTVYIKNDVFLKASKQSLDTLADNVNFLILKYQKERFENNPVPTEFQMDCDWTLKSKDNYFYFLKKLKQVSNKEISVTLRLYPFKYPDKMGVPPVDKAMLMCYNLIQPLDDKTKNSILDLKELKSYLNTDQKYPLHLDVALPIYSWMQVFQNDRFSAIIYTNNQEVKKILKPIKPLWFEVTKDTVINETYLRIGDKIKFEETDAPKLLKAIDIIKSNVSLDKKITVSLFHLDDEQLKNFSDEKITSFYTTFSR